MNGIQRHSPSQHYSRMLFSLVAIVVLLAGESLRAQDRVALLIANSDYAEHQLPEAKANVEKLATSAATT